ncbi:MAG: HU family DNA-binding protein [Bacteroidaceae bacterium]|jgi:nucleoid DNA-binding protein|nr:HU family DNA-binding protein [Bacteroidaceae bacterium]
MNNKEFITDLASRTKLSSKEAASLASATVSAIIGELLEENSIFVPGFGTFEVKKKLERVLVNPTTKQKMLVPPKMTVNFKPNTSLKLRVKK